MRAVLVGMASTAIAAVGLLLAAPEASAETCAAHLVREGVSQAVDIAEHRANPAWGPSPCDTPESSPSNGAAKSDDTKPEEPERKSRFCRKHWYC